MELSLMTSDYFSKVKLPYGEVMQSLGLLFAQSHTSIHAKFVEPKGTLMSALNEKKSTNQHNQKGSILLSNEENELLFSLIGHSQRSLVAAVVQFLVTRPPSHSKWNKIVTGVASFVKDRTHKSYLIRIFDIDAHKRCVWQQEIVNEINYKIIRSNFHTFESNDCLVGLYFANDTEANKFHYTVHKHKYNLRVHSGKGSRVTYPERKMIDLNRNHVVNGFQPIMDSKNRKEIKKKKKITKKDIGSPMNFIHVEHIGWEQTIAMNNQESSQIRKFLQYANLTSSEEADENSKVGFFDATASQETMAETMEKLETDLENLQLKPQSNNQRLTWPHHLPSPPSKLIQPMMTLSEESFNDPQSILSLPEIEQRDINIPAPSLISSPAPPLSVAKLTSLKSNDEEIKSAKLDTESLQSSSSHSTSSSSDRDELLNAIRAGVKLKPVGAAYRPPSYQEITSENPLTLALQERKKALGHTDDESSSTESEFEWS